jgi:hypothetical protein
MRSLFDCCASAWLRPAFSGIKAGVKAWAALLLSLNVALTGCASCFIDAIPQGLGPEPGVALDCDPLLAEL